MSEKRFFILLNGNHIPIRVAADKVQETWDFWTQVSQECEEGKKYWIRVGDLESRNPSFICSFHSSVFLGFYMVSIDSQTEGLTEQVMRLQAEFFKRQNQENKEDWRDDN